MLDATDSNAIQQSHKRLTTLYESVAAEAARVARDFSCYAPFMRR
jgi:hypothetical protein